MIDCDEGLRIHLIRWFPTCFYFDPYQDDPMIYFSRVVLADTYIYIYILNILYIIYVV